MARRFTTCLVLFVLMQLCCLNQLSADINIPRMVVTEAACAVWCDPYCSGDAIVQDPKNPKSWGNFGIQLAIIGSNFVTPPGTMQAASAAVRAGIALGKSGLMASGRSLAGLGSQGICATVQECSSCRRECMNKCTTGDLSFLGEPGKRLCPPGEGAGKKDTAEFFPSFRCPMTVSCGDVCALQNRQACDEEYIDLGLAKWCKCSSMAGSCDLWPLKGGQTDIICHPFITLDENEIIKALSKSKEALRNNGASELAQQYFVDLGVRACRSQVERGGKTVASGSTMSLINHLMQAHKTTEGAIVEIVSHSKNPAALSQRTIGGEYPLSQAIYRLWPNAVRSLIQMGANPGVQVGKVVLWPQVGSKSLVTSMIETNGASPLLLLVNKPLIPQISGEMRTEMLGSILDSPFRQPDLEDYAGNWPLKQVVTNISSDLDVTWVRMLLLGGADPNKKDKNGKSILWYAYEAYKQNPSDTNKKTILTLLIKGGADLTNNTSPDGWTLLLAAIRDKDNDLTQTILSTPAYVSKDPKNSQYNTPAGTDAINTENPYGLTPLLQAINDNNNTLVATLIDKGASLTLKNKDGLTPLLQAINNDNNTLVATLIEKGASLTLKNKDGLTPIWVAYYNQKFNALKALIDKGTSNFDTDKSKDGWTLLHALVNMSNIQQQHMQIIDSILSSNAGKAVLNKPIDTTINPQSYGLTPLMLATQQDNKDVVAKLMDAGADLFAKTTDGFTALDLAYKNQKQNAFNQLLTTDKVLVLAAFKNATPLMAAITKNNTSLIDTLLGRQSTVSTINAVDTDGKTALFYAVFQDDADTVKKLLSKGADATKKITIDNKSYSPLWFAHGNQKTNSRDALINSGINLATDLSYDGWTILHAAVRDGNQELITKILATPSSKQSIDVKTAFKDSSGATVNHTPLWFAYTKLQSNRSDTTARNILLTMIAATPDLSTNLSYDGWTILHAAARDGDAGLVQEALKNQTGKKCLTQLIRNIPNTAPSQLYKGNDQSLIGALGGSQAPFRYGTSDTLSTLTAAQLCSLLQATSMNAVFGDPKPGSAKTLFINDKTFAENNLQAAQAYIRQNIQCQAPFRYGTPDAFRILDEAKLCSLLQATSMNTAFGDPRPGAAKTLFINDKTFTENNLQDAQNYIRQNMKCSTPFRYGTKDTFNTLDQAKLCSLLQTNSMNTAFGDPKSGVAKTLFVNDKTFAEKDIRDAQDYIFTTMKCSRAESKYGAKNAFKILSRTQICSLAQANSMNTVFDDPISGVAKTLFINDKTFTENQIQDAKNYIKTIC